MIAEAIHPNERLVMENSNETRNNRGNTNIVSAMNKIPIPMDTVYQKRHQRASLRIILRLKKGYQAK